MAINIAAEVKRLLVRDFGHAEDKVTDAASFVDDLGCDSLDLVEILISAEDLFGVQINDDAAEKAVTVGDAVRLIERLRAGAAA